MSLLTVDAYVARIGPTEADNVAGSGPRGERELDTVKIEGALSFGASLVSGRLAARFPVLPSPAPEILLGIHQDIATYRLRYKTGDQSGVQDETYKRYQAALKLLDQIADGDLTIDGSAAGRAPDPVVVRGEPVRAPQILTGWLT
ncbi:phage protein Gp36 family protein [Camelimonas lactis]|uniref:Phage gp36-like protein n=1 Tax=Camelimonas lactis TaxID=659006 RepID=A0A4R2GW32_9HYPH|nr:phage protein Gp36 family protein [Camelimonas lactis]TCO15220.1 phage gp36-like protein [Camelimonas lactis]